MAKSDTMRLHEKILFLFFRVIERVVSRKNKGHSFTEDLEDIKSLVCSENAEYLWVFTSTIGELNAIYPFISNLLSLLDIERVVILTDHPHYTDAYLKVFPQAVIVDHGTSGNITTQVAVYAPLFFVVAEIPCSLSDAPCRFSYRVLYEMKSRNVPVVLVNGWLYGYGPSCRIDAVQKSLLGKVYIDSIDLFCVQTNRIRSELISQGVNDEKVFFTGNIKFDALQDNTINQMPDTELAQFLDELTADCRPTIVAGCVTNIPEQIELLDVLVELRNVLPNVLLILAPRHPENVDRMEVLNNLLRERELPYLLRTDYRPGSTQGKAVVVLNTTGELRHVYDIGCVCYVGLNHNVLEPLALHKPVVVVPGWNEEFPSFPVYSETLSAGLIDEVSEQHTLYNLLLSYLKENDDSEPVARVSKLDALAGATGRNIRIMKMKGLIPVQRG